MTALRTALRAESMTEGGYNAQGKPETGILPAGMILGGDG
jgi:hypothetical protein